MKGILIIAGIIAGVVYLNKDNNAPVPYQMGARIPPDQPLYRNRPGGRISSGLSLAPAVPKQEIVWIATRERFEVGTH